MKILYHNWIALILLLALAAGWGIHAAHESSVTLPLATTRGPGGRVQSAFRPSAGHVQELRADDTPQQGARALDLTVLPPDLKKSRGPFDNVLARSGNLNNPTDDAILAAGGVTPQLPIVTDVIKSNPTVKSINAKDWHGAANLLVNALREGKNFEVSHDQLMAFLLGKDLLGWPENSRNWIGDELMTALRQDMPQSAFELLKSIAEDRGAPAAMRDYSVQHISHLMTSGVIGREGTDFIWQTLAKNDPQTLSTALISLYRLSEQVPNLVSEKQVHEAAERLRESPDERTRITAASILKK